MSPFGVLAVIVLSAGGGGLEGPAAGEVGGVEAAGAAAVWQAPALQDTAYNCLRCHADKRRSFSQGVHSERDIRCHQCHGGDPRAVDVGPAHRGNRFNPESKVEVAQLCSSCHSDPDQMRQYGLPAGEMAEFRTSRHGEVLFQGNVDAPTCTDCHDAHTILRPTDARSNVYPSNIPATCAKCHDDAAMMRKYGLPSDQHERYMEGAHGRAVFEDGNFAAPTCIGCHGSHSALPPKATEISTVCDRCHVLLGAEFHDSPHGAAARRGAMPGCLGCHENHGTAVAPPEQITALCTDCHEPDSPAALAGANIQTRVMAAREDLRLAEEAIDLLSRQGRRVYDAKFRYATAFTAFSELKKAQHSLDVDMVDDLGREVSSISREIRETAEVGEEHRWEHKLLLIPIWFLALATVILVVFKLGGQQKPEP